MAPYDPKANRPTPEVVEDSAPVDALLGGVPDDPPPAPAVTPPVVPQSVESSAARFGMVAGVAGATVALLGLIAMWRRRRRRRATS